MKDSLKRIKDRKYRNEISFRMTIYIYMILMSYQRELPITNTNLNKTAGGCQYSFRGPELFEDSDKSKFSKNDAETIEKFKS